MFYLLHLLADNKVLIFPEEMRIWSLWNCIWTASLWFIKILVHFTTIVQWFLKLLLAVSACVCTYNHLVWCFFPSKVQYLCMTWLDVDALMIQREMLHIVRALVHCKALFKTPVIFTVLRDTVSPPFSLILLFLLQTINLSNWSLSFCDANDTENKGNPSFHMTCHTADAKFSSDLL